jgi:ESCRT-II complex subunit VPS36
VTDDTALCHILQADEHDEAAVAQRLLQAAQESPLMVGSCAAALKVSLVLAQEHLNAAEQLGLLCRDETLEGVRFYPNLFAEFAAAQSSGSGAAAAS